MEEKIILRINDYTTLNNGVSASEGQRIFELIRTALRKNKSVELDFGGINILTTAFLNSAIGQLYGEFPDDFLSRSLTLKNVLEDDLPRFKMVTERAKSFYKDENKFDETVNTILDGEH